jgi:cytosine/adenosine deaminase-related metal-dependent hydrolase
MSSTLLVRGKYVISKITGPASAEVVADGAVLQRDGEILEVGRYADLSARHPAAEVIGSPNAVVMPGLVNDHFHVGLTPFQLGAPDLPLELWGLARIGARTIDPYLDQLYGAVQMIESGTTTVQAIHSTRRGSGPVDLEVADKVVTAYQESGMRVSYAPSIADQNSLVAGAKGGEAAFAAQLPADLAERFTSFMARGYRPVDEVMATLEEADSHVLEPADLWIERMDQPFRDQAPRIVLNPPGFEGEYWLFGDRDQGVPEAIKRKITWENAKRLYRLG